MNRKKSVRSQGYKGTRTLVTCTLIICVLSCRILANSKVNDPEKKNSSLQVYLLRDVTIKNDIVTLGLVSIIRGEESLVARASEITLGRISVPGQEIIIDRPILLSRLASSQIPASKVILTGAEKITVKQQQQIIKAAEFVELASSFLKKNPPAGSFCRSEPIRIPKDLVVPRETGDIKLSPRLAAGAARGQVKVQIDALADDKVVGTREVTFRLRYNCRRAVALIDIPVGTPLSPENVKIEKTLSNRPEPAGWKPPYGLITRRRVAANAAIRPDMVGPVQSAVIVKRNQVVLIRVEKPGLLVTAIGKTMQDGRAGEYIKVRNADSQRIILVKVNEDQTVEPVF